MSSYAFIKQTAKDSKLRVTDLLALAPQNDPFYTGTSTDIAQAEWFAAIWRRAGYTSRVHLRRVHYWTVSQDPPIMMHNGQPYQNTTNCWKYLCQASKMARYLGYVKIADIVDHKNPDPHVHAAYSDDNPSYRVFAPDVEDPYIMIQGIDEGVAQPYHLEVWVEKSTMSDILLPVVEDFHANLVTFEGEASITACYDLVERIKESGYKPTRIWYISDFDPAGNSMPVATSRKVEFLLGDKAAYDVRVRALALTPEQVQQYRLPRTPIKETERRAGRFEDAFGAGATELDALEALHPGELARIVRQAMAPYYSDEAAAAVAQAQEELQRAIDQRIRGITIRYEAEIEAIRKMLNELRAVERAIDAEEYAVEKFDPEVDEEDDWLFDSGRDYGTQIGWYKVHKGQ